MLDEIISGAIEQKTPLAETLRRCLVVAAKLKYDGLADWVRNELNGYPEIEGLPDYRVLRVHARGLFLGIASRMNDQPLASGVLSEEHREWATTAYLRQGIATYEHLVGDDDDGKGGLQIPWPAGLVARYQESFFEGFVLNRAWQDIPRSSVVGLIDTVRNRLLEFALELVDQANAAGTPLDQIERAKVDQALTVHIYGGNNVVATQVAGGVKQIGELTVAQGDFASLARVLEQLGIAETGVSDLKDAIEKDAGKSMGEHVLEWLAKAGKAVGKGAGKVAGNVATATLSKALLAYFGLE